MKILFAVSGGIDSMCMADRFSHAENGDALAHCNFHLRGEESDNDALLVEQWAKSRGIRLYRADFDTLAYAKEHGLSIEMAARELRYNWFAELARSEGFDAVAVAHNANDNVETLLLNLLRGCGGRGLKGMSAEGFIPGSEVKLLRPLLDTSREEIQEWCKTHGVPYREDSSNAETVFKRNKLRHKVLPVFKEINPSYLQTIAKDMEHFAQENSIAEDYWNGIKDEVLKDGRISLEGLAGLKHWKYVLFRALEPLGMNIRNQEALSALVEARLRNANITFSGKIFKAPGHSVITGSDYILIKAEEQKAQDSIIAEKEGIYEVNGSILKLELLDADGDWSFLPDGSLCARADRLPFPLTLRKWEKGDWMQPFGMKGKKKLSDLFTDLKYDLARKEAALVIYCPGMDAETEGHVAAVAGLRMDEALRIPEGFKGKYLKISLI